MRSPVRPSLSLGFAPSAIPELQNRIDREDNSFRADINGDFGPLLIGDNLLENVWVAALDEAGNLGDPILVINDVVAPDAPDASLITIVSNCPGTDDTLEGAPGAFEPGCLVRIYSDEFLGTIIAEATAEADGSFGPVSIGDNVVEVVYLTCTDMAGNESAVTVLDGVAGNPINDIEPPAPVNLDEVDLIEEADGEDFVVIGPGATDGDVASVRVFTNPELTDELGGGLSPIAIPASGPQSIGVNVGIAGTITGFPRVWLVAEDGACNRSQPVSIDLDVEVEVSDPAEGRYVFNAEEPNNNTLRGLEKAVDGNIEIQISRGVANAGNATLDVPLLGVAFSDEAGAFQAIDLGRVAQATSYLVGIDDAGNRSEIAEIDTQDTVPPPAPWKDRITLIERTRSFNDTIQGTRGAVGRRETPGEETLFLKAYANASLTALLPDFPIEIPAAGFNATPAPGSFPETSIGDNHADNDTDPHSIVGTANVWLTACDEFGNESEATVCALDVVTPDPDPTKIFVFSENPQIESFIVGQNWAVEPHSEVLVTSDPEGLCVIASIHADENGAWPSANLGPILRKPDTVQSSFPHPNVRDEVYVRSIDPAGNRSSLITISVEVGDLRGARRFWRNHPPQWPCGDHRHDPTDPGSGWRGA
ncbi:MAG: hypothetical protein H6751_10045 [Candidatus Omnitrophica bacterium]|nr:hypothetical protein [Candidatus Omnitrophota bacterium]